MVFASVVSLVAAEATAASTPSIIEITPPPPVFGTDAMALRLAVEGEVQQMDAALVKDRRHVVVSLALSGAPVVPFVCNVNATVRDARTGMMLAIISTDARAQGPISREQRKEIAYSAVRSAVRRVPDAVRAKR